MALIDKLVQPDVPRTAYLWSKGDGTGGALGDYATGLKQFKALIDEQNVGGEQLVFQYWPESLSDDYTVDYAEHKIPGGSHPLYQWVGGGGRTISFQAVFTSEVNTSHILFGKAAPTQLTPSRETTADVAGALNRLRSWLAPGYNDNSGGAVANITPPPRLGLAFPNSGLGGKAQSITVILRSAPITIEAWFPNGQPRVATVDLTFNEVVQSGGGGEGTTTVKFIGRSAYAQAANDYTFRGSTLNPLVGGL